MSSNVQPILLAQVRKDVADRGLTMESAADWALTADAHEQIDRIVAAHRLSDAATVVWVAWPALKYCAARFVRHVGTRYPGRRQDMAHEAVGAAVRAYHENIDQARRNSAPGAFLRTLVDHGCDLLRRDLVGVKASGKRVTWDCLQRPLTQWIRQEGIEWVYLDDLAYLGAAEIAGGADYLAHQIMGHREYGLMKGSEGQGARTASR